MVQNQVSQICKLLVNPLRLEMLQYVYSTKDGANVSELADRFVESDAIGMSGVSQYLKQLTQLGILRRTRAGRFVNYLPDASRADEKCRQALEVILRLAPTTEPSVRRQVFATLMNPFRAGVIGVLAQARHPIAASEICKRTLHAPRHLRRDLKFALDAGILSSSDDDDAVACYSIVTPLPALAEVLIALLPVNT